MLGMPRVWAQPRHSVIVLVDESGTLRRDPGWRNKAAALLAYGLPEGNALAISGFGNRGRKLELRPLALADAGEGRQNRELLAMRSSKLGAGDQQTDIYGAITQSLDQFTGMAPEIRQAMSQMFIRDPKAVDRPQRLTDRQREVLQMLAEGRSLREISHLLKISYRTVRFHKVRIMEELGTSKNADLVKYAMKHGMISPV